MSMIHAAGARPAFGVHASASCAPSPRPGPSRQAPSGATDESASAREAAFAVLVDHAIEAIGAAGALTQLRTSPPINPSTSRIAGSRNGRHLQ